MGVPQVYRKSDERAIASFDSEDIVTGLGFVEFLGIASTDDSATTLHLITNKSMWSDPTGSISTGTTDEFNFDTPAFNLPRFAKGTALFSVGLNGNGNSSVTNIAVQLIHVDADSVETTISSTITSANKTTLTAILMVFLEIPITTDKQFKKGDKLRLEVLLTKVSGGGNPGFGHDPQNQKANAGDPASGGTSIMRLSMPFRVDI